MTHATHESQAPIKTAAEFFRRADGKRVLKQITGVKTFEDWPEMVREVTHSLEQHGAVPGVDYIVKEDRVEWGGGGHMLRPRMRASETGKFTVRSKDYGFQPDRLDCQIRGDMKGAKVNTGGQLVKTYAHGMTVTFTIITQ